MKKLITILILIASLIAGPAFAANYYLVRDCPNNGDGSSWSCAASPGAAGAFNDTPGPGDACTDGGATWGAHTYWYAGSDTAYSGTCFRKGVGGLTIKKASGDSHGTDTGWDAAYGTKQAVLGPLTLWLSTITIDGQYRTTAESGYGFKITAAGNLGLINTTNNIETHGHIIQYVELTHSSFDANADHAITLYGNGSNTIRYVYAHDLSGLCFKGNIDGAANTTGGFEGLTIEESVCGDIGKTTGSGHTELMKDDGGGDDVTIRNNLFYDWISTGGIILGSNHDNWKIYNNIFTQRSAGIGSCGNGVISAQTGVTGVTNIKVYNNTFANLSTVCPYVFGDGLGDMSGSGNEVKNNLFWNIASTPATCTGGCTKGTNWYSTVTGYTPSGTEIAGSGDPFTSSGTEDFTLAADTATRDNTTGYDTDRAGNAFTTSTGAYQLNGSTARTVTFTTTAPCTVSPASAVIPNNTTTTGALTVPNGWKHGTTSSGTWTDDTVTTAAITADTEVTLGCSEIKLMPW